MKKLSVLGLAALVAGAFALTISTGVASATVHPIQSAECAAPPGTNGSTDGDPPGITGQSSADNFAQPAEATINAGALIVVIFPTDFTGPASNGDNGDQHCAFPEGGSHPDDADDAGVDKPFPGNAP